MGADAALGLTADCDSDLDQPALAVPQGAGPVEFVRCYLQGAGGGRPSEPPPQPVPLEGDLGDVAVPAGPVEPDPRGAIRVEVAGGVRGDPVAHLHEAGPLAVEGCGRLPAGQLMAMRWATTSASAWANTPALGRNLPPAMGIAMTSPIANTPSPDAARVDGSTGR